jgi:hypothetical protein
MTSTTTLVRHLRVMLHLTRTEAQIARIRQAQARTDEVRRELVGNAEKADHRSELIIEKIREVGGVPDIVTPFLGRLNALLKATIEQAEPFDEALLQDLALEQQLLGRARYLTMLGDVANNPSVRALGEHLEAAHAQTVEWINSVLAQEALGGPVALRATPVQRVVGGLSSAAGLPLRVAREGVNRTVDTAQDVENNARKSLRASADQVLRLGKAARDIAVSGRNASLGTAERVAHREGATRTAHALHDTRVGLGTLEEHELPIKGYPELNQRDAVDHIRQLREQADVRTIMAYEQAHKDRVSVLEAAQSHSATLAEQTLEKT